MRWMRQCGGYRFEQGDHATKDWAGGGRRDRLVEGLARFRERGGQKGGEKVGKNPTDRGKPNSKRHLACDRKGIPLAVVLSAANVHYSKVFEDVVDAIEPIRRLAGKPGHPSAQISCTPTRATTSHAAGRRSEAAPSRNALPAADFANIGTKPGGVQGFIALLHQLSSWC